jgi:hypothetical protein
MIAGNFGWINRTVKWLLGGFQKMVQAVRSELTSHFNWSGSVVENY